MTGSACDKVGKSLDDFLDGRLSKERAAAVRRHIMRCPACRRELLARKRVYSRVGADSRLEPSGDWLDFLERKITRGGPWQGILQAMFLPWEKKIPLLVGALIIILVLIMSLRQLGCEAKREETPVAPVPTLTPPPPATPAVPTPEIPTRLRKSPMSSVLILDEPEEAKKIQPPPGVVDDSYSPFQDQQITLTVSRVAPALEEAVNIALATGGQVITYPIKGFENMGPHERTLVFPFSTYYTFLTRLGDLGTVEHSPLIRSDYVTARLTVLAPAGTPPGAVPPGS